MYLQMDWLDKAFMSQVKKMTMKQKKTKVLKPADISI